MNPLQRHRLDRSARRGVERADRRASTVKEWPISQASGYGTLFNLLSAGADTFEIDARLAAAGGVWIAGAMVDAIADDGLDLDADVWTPSAAVDADVYIYLELDRSDSTATIFAAETLPDGSASEYEHIEIVPLWFLPWSETLEGIDAENIMDLRHAVRLPAMA